MVLRLRLSLAALACALLLVGCAQDVPASDRDRAVPPSAPFDYQLGGAYPPADDVRTVVRDRTAEPAGRGYDVCYVNGFQTQPDEVDRWEGERAGLMLHRDGVPLVDPGWPDEFLFDTSTAQKRTALAEIVDDWIAGCAADGFDAVEIDNLDSYVRSNGLLTRDDNVALAEEYARMAHRHGLAIAQKNAPDLVPTLHAAGYDFAVAESCARFDECDAYAEYDVVLDIEYIEEGGEDGFAAACGVPGHPPSMILRDRALSSPDTPGYVRQTCAG